MPVEERAATSRTDDSFIVPYHSVLVVETLKVLQPSRCIQICQELHPKMHNLIPEDERAQEKAKEDEPR